MKKTLLELILSFLCFLVVNTYYVSGFFFHLCHILENPIKNIESIHCTKLIHTANIAIADKSDIRKDEPGRWPLEIVLMWIGLRSLNCCFCVEKQKHVASRKVSLF